MRYVLVTLAVLAAAACSNQAQNGNDGGPDANTGVDAAPGDASKDVVTADVVEAGCAPCKVGTSVVGNCCVQ